MAQIFSSLTLVMSKEESTLHHVWRFLCMDYGPGPLTGDLNMYLLISAKLSCQFNKYLNIYHVQRTRKEVKMTKAESLYLTSL